MPGCINLSRFIPDGAHRNVWWIEDGTQVSLVHYMQSECLIHCTYCSGPYRKGVVVFFFFKL